MKYVAAIKLGICQRGDEASKYFFPLPPSSSQVQDKLVVFAIPSLEHGGVSASSGRRERKKERRKKRERERKKEEGIQQWI